MSELTEEQKAARKTLFQLYAASNEEVEKAEAAVEAAKKDRSDIVANINKDFGGGPFRVGGELLRIANRKDTYFFRGVKVTGEEI
jgi:hypothetical protein